MVGEKTRTGLIVIILAVTLLMVFGLYANALSPSIVTGLGTVLLVLVTVIYTINTHEQTRATRASYAPSLDVSIYPKSDHLSFEIINRGEGVARNIVLRVRVGEYEYHGHIADSLSPGERLFTPYGPSDDRVAVVPRFYEPRIERRDAKRTSPRRALKQGSESPLTAMRNIHGVAQLSLPELIELKQQIRGGWTTPNGDLFLPLHIEATYTDVTESNNFVTESPDYADTIVKAEGGNIASILTGTRGTVAYERQWAAFKRKLFGGRDLAPFKETLETDVRRRLSSVTSSE